jgi:hypothetical protein
VKKFSENKFLRWAKSKDVVIDPRYPDAAALCFEPDSNIDRFWEVPESPEVRPSFIVSIGIEN